MFLLLPDKNDNLPRNRKVSESRFYLKKVIFTFFLRFLLLPKNSSKCNSSFTPAFSSNGKIQKKISRKNEILFFC